MSGSLVGGSFGLPSRFNDCQSFRIVLLPSEIRSWFHVFAVLVVHEGIPGFLGDENQRDYLEDHNQRQTKPDPEPHGDLVGLSRRYPLAVR